MNSVFCVVDCSYVGEKCVNIVLLLVLGLEGGGVGWGCGCGVGGGLGSCVLDLLMWGVGAVAPSSYSTDSEVKSCDNIFWNLCAIIRPSTELPYCSTKY